jgi:hypothetical protein
MWIAGEERERVSPPAGENNFKSINWLSFHLPLSVCKCGVVCDVLKALLGGKLMAKKFA